MTNVKLLVFALLLILFSCKNEIEPDYCKIWKTDQSGTYSPELTEEENKLAHTKRKEKILGNFNSIITEVKKNGFPFLNDVSKTTDSCKYYAITATLIHINQTRPDIFYSDSIRNLFQQEINADRLNKDLLFTPITIGSHFPVCDSLKSKIELAIKSWQLKASMMEKFTFKKC